MKTEKVLGWLVLAEVMFSFYYCCSYAVGQIVVRPSLSSPANTGLAPQDEVSVENQILKAQLQEMRSHDADLLMTVHWALAGVIGVVVLVAGFSAYTNFKIYEKEKSALERDLRVFINASIADVQNKAFVEIHKVVASNFEAFQTELKRDVRKLSRDLASAQYRLQDMEAKSWFDRKVYQNSFSCHVDMLKTSVDLDHTYYFGSCIESLILDLKSGARPDASDIASIARIIKESSSEISSQHSLTIASFQSVLSSHFSN